MQATVTTLAEYSPTDPEVSEVDRMWVGVIRHPYGENFYASRSKKGIERQIAEYARLWWHDRPLPMDGEDHQALTDREVISIYFTDHEGESYNFGPCIVQ